MRRIAFYSYDEQGLGHVRRSVAVAHALSAAGPASILLIAGAREAALLPLPPGSDTLALPAPETDFTGGLRHPSLGLDVAGTVRMRADALRSALGAYRPDALIVDRLPLGVHDELGQSLGLLRAMGTRLVLGLRDVLDEPERVRAEWERTGAIATLRRSYDAIWVYGDPAVHDPAAECGLPADVQELVRYTGYLARHDDARAARAQARRRELRLPAGRLALCLLGGGEDGHRLGEAFARAARPPGTTGVIVTGPFMGKAEHRALRAAARRRRDLRVVRFVPDAGVLAGAADDVVAMGGYNTTCEILASGVRALVVPRGEPRREQLIRARSLSARGALDTLAPADLTVDALSAWLAGGGERPRPRRPIDLDGLRRVPALLDEVLARPARPGRRASARFTRSSTPLPANTRGVSA